MLANGAELHYGEPGTEIWTELTGLKEIPEIGDSPEKVENTCLKDKHKMYELGIGDLGDLTYKFKYENKSETSPYRVMRKAAAEKKVLAFKETLPDGTTYTCDAQVSVKRSGGGVNGPMEFDLTLVPQSEIVITDPTTK